MFKFIICLLMFSSINVEAKDRIKLRELYIEVENTVSTNTADFEIPDREIDGYLNLGYNVAIGNHLYQKTKITSMFSSAQFRRVALDMEIGLQIINELDLYLGHTSAHTLDMVGFNNYPQRNVVGLRINLVGE